MIILKTYSGHIRNHKSLCEQLGLDTALPREKKEEQIIIAAYKKWGGDMANHIYGMFSLALYDTDTFFCLRDQFGTKPFYYYVTDTGELLFGTTIREIMDKDGFTKELNQKMLQIYLTMTYTTVKKPFSKALKSFCPDVF